MSTRVALIVNGKARRGQEWYQSALDAFQSRDVEITQSDLVTEGRAIPTLVKKAIESEVDIVCVGCGDGTLSGISQQFIGHEATLGILPMGTGNSLAHDLEIPSDVTSAVDIILAGKRQPIDLGEVNGHPFVNVATIGLTTLIAQNLNRDAKRRFGRAVYLVAMFRAVLAARRFTVTLHLPDGDQTHRSIQVVIGNGRFHGGPFAILPEARIDSGDLSGYTVNTSRRSVLMQYAIRLWRGTHTDMPEVAPFRTQQLQLDTRPIKRITVDGEVKLTTPATCRAIPRALTVMVPESFGTKPNA